MKVNSQQLEDYIYFKVVAPIKQLKVPTPRRGIENPFERLGRGNAYLEIQYEPLDDRFSHRYQRHAAELKRKLQIVYREGGVGAVVGEMDNKKRELVLYYDPCQEVGIVPILSKIQFMFSKTPHYQVKVVKGERKEYTHDW